MNKFRILLLLFILSLSLLSFNNVLASGRETGYGLNSTANVGNLPAAFLPFTGLASDNILDRIGGLVGAILSFVGVIFLALIIYGGVLWMTASGNEQTVAKAQKVITWSSIGLITLFSSFAIVQFIGREAVRPTSEDNIEIDQDLIDEIYEDDSTANQLFIDESVSRCVAEYPNNPHSNEYCKCQLDPNYAANTDDDYCQQISVIYFLWFTQGF